MRKHSCKDPMWLLRVTKYGKKYLKCSVCGMVRIPGRTRLPDFRK